MREEYCQEDCQIPLDKNKENKSIIARETIQPNANKTIEPNVSKNIEPNGNKTIEPNARNKIEQIASKHK